MRYIVSVLILLAGCASSTTRAPAVVAASPSATEPVRVDGFEVSLTQLNVNGSVYQAAATGYRREAGAWSLQGTIVVRDPKHRMFRLLNRSAVTSAVDARGREIAAGPAPMQNYDRKEGFRPQARQNSGESTSPDLAINFSLGSSRPIAGLQRLAGTVNLEYVVADEECSVAVPEVEKPVELPGGARLTLKALEMDEKGFARRFAIDIMVPTSDAPPVVQTVELLDAQGAVVLMGAVQENVLVGTTLRTRFASDGNGSYGRQTGAPKTLHIKVLTKFEHVDIPFAWGPIGGEGG